MAGGLLNLVNTGQENLILNGNPSKTFWKTTYAKFTNFGMQKFRLDYEGLKTLGLTTPTTYTFRVPRYADLLSDTYLVFTLPNIWSPLHVYKSQYPYTYQEGQKNKDIDYYDLNNYIPYGFKWIDDIGTNMIEEISIDVGGQNLQKFSGDYLTAKIKKDFPGDKVNLINEMIGNVSELNNPGAAGGQEGFFARNGKYPNAIYNNSPEGAEPSIKGRKLYIPISTWFSNNSKLAFPLVSLQYNELIITIRIRPINELFRIRDITNPNNSYAYKSPNFNTPLESMYLFLQTPPEPSKNQIKKLPNLEDLKNIKSKNCVVRELIKLGIWNPYAAAVYENEITKLYNTNINTWDPDVHLIGNYIFLSNDEQQVFAMNCQEYIIPYIHETTFKSINTTDMLELDSIGLVKSWMWFIRRDDVFLRNEWSNYSNNDYLLTTTGLTYNLPYINKKNTCSSGYIQYRDKDNNIKIDSDNNKFRKYINRLKYYDNKYTVRENDPTFIDDYESIVNKYEFNKCFPPTMEMIIQDIMNKINKQTLNKNERENLKQKMLANIYPIWPQQGGEDTHCQYYQTFWSNNTCRYNLTTSGPRNIQPDSNIMLSAAILFDGAYRENMLDAGVYNFIEKFNRILGKGTNGIYCYNFDVDPYAQFLFNQPGGAINMNAFSKINLEVNTIEPPKTQDPQFKIICNNDNNIIGAIKGTNNIYKYRYDFVLMEERVNIIKFIGGNVALVFSN